MLNGYELQFKRHATIEKNDESKVPVLLWKLPKTDERSLDVYEGFPKYYRKEIIPIDLNGEAVDAMVYIMNGDRPLETPTVQYYDTIEQGYKENGMDTSYLETALAEAIQSENFERKKKFKWKWRCEYAVSWILCENYSLEKYFERG